jgi:hypothetical protein
MNLPKRLKLSPHTYGVKTTTAPMNVGECDAQQHILYVSGCQSPSNQGETLLHEALHALFEQTGIKSLLEKTKEEDLEEELVSRLSPPLLALLKDNPKAVAFWTQ